VYPTLPLTPCPYLYRIRDRVGHGRDTGEDKGGRGLARRHEMESHTKLECLGLKGEAKREGLLYLGLPYLYSLPLPVLPAPTCTGYGIGMDTG